jgi:hypothetical protein
LGGQQLKPVEFEVEMTFWGWSRAPERYVALLALPEDQTSNAALPSIACINPPRDPLR